MRRRQFLASGTALLSVALAGCGHPSVVLDMDEATADDVADAVSMAAEPGSEEYELVVTARENGSATRTGRYDLFDRTDTVRVDDTFYTVSETQTASGEATVYDVVLDPSPDDSTADLREVAFADLPEADRQRLERAVMGDHPSEDEEYRIGVDYGTAEEVGNESVFVPEKQYDVIVHEGDQYRVTVDSRTTSQGEYRYEVTEVASDVETFADRVRGEYLFTLAGLSESERAVVEEAIDEGYLEDDDAFRSVVDRIRDHEGIEVEDFYGTWLVEYESVEYLTYVEW